MQHDDVNLLNLEMWASLYNTNNDLTNINIYDKT